jgi:hypothetical protein
LAKEKRKEFYYIQNKIQRLCAMHAASFDKRELFRTHIPGPLSILHKLKFIITKV